MKKYRGKDIFMHIFYWGLVLVTAVCMIDVLVWTSTGTRILPVEVPGGFLLVPLAPLTVLVTYMYGGMYWGKDWS